ncbi:MAG: hypothetical protein Q8Q28_04635 [Pseudomonadota bacterium]|nr:hypothetical protein [Pseudomonadota bacterium]
MSRIGQTFTQLKAQYGRSEKPAASCWRLPTIPAEGAIKPLFRPTALAHPNPVKYPRQRVLVVVCDNYAYLVPFVEEDDYFFLKTIIPSRKATRDYLNQGEADAGN